MRVLVLNGSPREKGTVATLLKSMSDTVSKKHEVEWINVYDLQLNPYRMQNVGGNWTGKMFGKVYANRPICLSDKAALNADYETETYIRDSNYDPEQLPPGFLLKGC